MSRLTLRELCERTGVSRRAVQGYESHGLIRASDRNDRGHLLYDEEVVIQVGEIKFYNELGFRIKEIQTLTALSEEERREQLVHKMRDLRMRQQHIENLIGRLGEILKKQEI